MLKRNSSTILAAAVIGAIGGYANGQVQNFPAGQIINSGSEKDTTPGGAPPGGAFDARSIFDTNQAETGAKYVTSSANSTTPVVQLYATPSNHAGDDPYTPNPFNTNPMTGVATPGPVPPLQGSDPVNGLNYLTWTAIDLRQNQSTMSGSLAAGKTAVVGVNLASLTSPGWSLGNRDYGRPTGYVSLQLHNTNGTNVDPNTDYSISFGLVNRPDAPGGSAGNNYAGTGYTGSAGQNTPATGNYGNWVAPGVGATELKVVFSQSDGTILHDTPNSDQTEFLIPFGGVGNPLQSTADLIGNNLTYQLTATTFNFLLNGVSLIGGPQPLTSALDPTFVADPNLVSYVELASDNGNINTDAAYITGDSNSPSSAIEIKSIQVGDLPVPEPTSIGLLGLGGMALLARSRKRV